MRKPSRVVYSTSTVIARQQASRRKAFAQIVNAPRRG